MGFFSHKRVVPLLLVLDIESGSIGAGLFEIQKGCKPVVRYTTRENFAFQKTLGGNALFATMRRTLESVLHRVEHAGLFALNAVGANVYKVGPCDVFFSSPWYTSEIKTLTFAYDTPRLITETLVEKLFDAEERAFEKGGAYELLERKIMRICINGSPTAHPYGKKAAELLLSVALNVAPRDVLEKVRAAVSKHFPSHPVFCHTFSLGAFATLRDSYPAGDFVFMHVGGEITDIAVVKEDIITETLSIPLGHNTLLRNVERFFTGTPHAALESLLALSREDRAGTSEKILTERAIDEVQTSWRELLNGALFNVSGDIFVPRNLFLLGSGRYMRIFEEFLGSDESDSGIETPAVFDVAVVAKSPDTLFASYHEAAVRDTTLAIEANFLSRFSHALRNSSFPKGGAESARRRI